MTRDFDKDFYIMLIWTSAVGLLCWYGLYKGMMFLIKV